MHVITLSNASLGETDGFGSSRSALCPEDGRPKGVLKPFMPPPLAPIATGSGPKVA